MFYTVTTYIDDTVKLRMEKKYPEDSLGDAIMMSLRELHNPTREKRPDKRPVGRPRKEAKTKLYPGVRKREAIQKGIYDTLINGPVPTEKLIEKITNLLGVTERSVSFVLAKHIPAIKHGNQIISGKKVWCSWLNRS